MRSCSEPMVSVIIPVYNSTEYLHQCIDSVLNQTLQNIEVICVDDGSTDESFTVLQEYTSKDSRVKVLTQPNLYAGTARNNGLNIAKGKYIIFLDADDFFESRMLEDSVRRMEKDEADICIFGAWRYNDTIGTEKNMSWMVPIHKYPQKRPFAATDVPDSIFQLSTPCPWNKVFRLDYIRELGICFQNLHNTNDLFFVFTAMAMGKRITWMKTPYVHYRVNHVGSIQDKKKEYPFDFYYALKRLQEELIARNRYVLFKNSYQKLIYSSFNYNYPSLSMVDYDNLEALQKVCNGLSPSDQSLFLSTEFLEFARLYRDICITNKENGKHHIPSILHVWQRVINNLRDVCSKYEMRK